MTGSATDLETARRFVRAGTRLGPVALVPEIRLYQAGDPVGLWQRVEVSTGRTGLDPPFWAFAWAGGQALARYLLDHPETVRGRAVVDVASGSGLVAIAAARAGAAAVTAYDIDPFATAAIEVNAAANEVSVEAVCADVLDRDEIPAAGTGAVLVADAFYQRELAARVTAFAGRGRVRGADVLVGDFGRAYLPARSAPGGPLAAALAPSADPDLVFAAVRDELASPPSPAVLVVEDAHWADGATLDVLRYLGTRVQSLPAVLVMTYRDDGLGRDHPLRGVLGALGSTAATRLRLTRLTSAAVRKLAAATTVDPGELFRLTGGNPFFVTEVLANPTDIVPPTVVDAVLARVRTLSAAAQTALDRLAVVPAGAEVGLLRVLAGDLGPVAEAERAGVVEVHGDVVSFRHELARRAVAESLPASVQLELNADVLRALVARADCDSFRALHHAVQAGDDDAVITHGETAAREARRVGADLQAAACYAQVLARGHRLPTARRAALGEAYSWALSNSNQLQAAVAAAATAAELWRQDGDDPRLVRALVTLSRHQWLTRRTAKARDSAERAIELARPFGDSYQKALATANLGGLLVINDQEQDGLPHLEAGLGIAERAGAASVAALCRNYLGSARLQLGDPGGCEDLLRSMAQATELGNHEYVMRAYYNLIEGLWRLGDYRGALGYIEQAEHYGRDRDFRGDRAPPPAGAGRHPDAAAAAAGHAGQSGRSDRPPAGDPAAGRGRPVERRDRAAAGRLDPHRRPSRLRHPGQAGRAHPARGRGPRRRDREQPCPRRIIRTRREHLPVPCRALGDHPRHEGHSVMSVPDTAMATRTTVPLVRDAVPADYPAIREVVIAAYRQYADLIPPDVFSPYLADLLDLDRHAHHGRLFVVEVDGLVRASGSFYPDASVQGLGWPPGWASGRALAVHPDARGLGVARALIATCERLAREAGVPVFAFHTASFMTKAIALYDRLGFSRAPESTSTWPRGTAGSAPRRSCRSPTCAACPPSAP
jgi:predicted nicotinamide N-methyase/ribosomal protein S18 acetylase RimI-like enzyme/tetratricopeptide (TPR) repeat protein